jgi:hypothetical protein
MVLLFLIVCINNASVPNSTEVLSVKINKALTTEKEKNTARVS